MLLITTEDMDGHPVILTMGWQATDRVLRLYRPKPDAGDFAGDMFASVILSKDDAAELKKNL